MSAEPFARTATPALVAALLEQGRALHVLSCVFTALSLAGLPLYSVLLPGPNFPAMLAVAAAVGALETYLAVRVGFDAAIFRFVSEGKLDWPDVDRGLSDLKLAASSDQPRSRAGRAGGALRLLGLQGAAVAAQGVLLLVALVAHT